jgi:hypothetical protein
MVAYSKLGTSLPCYENPKGKSVGFINLKMVAYSKLGTSFPRSRTPRAKSKSFRLIHLKMVDFLQQAGHQLPSLQNTKGKSVGLIDQKMVAYSKLGTSVPRSRTSRVRILA